VDILFITISTTILPFFTNLFFTSILLKVGHYYKWFDSVDERKIHTGKIPRIGGIGIFWTAQVSMIVFLYVANSEHLLKLILRTEYASLFAGCLIIHLVGLMDDFKNLKAHYKLIAQIAAAVVFVGAGNYFRSVYLPGFGVTFDLGMGGPLLTFLWIVGVTNAINLIDGIDGLSGSLSAMAALFLGLAALSKGNYSAAIIALSIFGALLGFLFFNFPPAHIFMGDSGSLYVGFLLAALPIVVFRFEHPEKALTYGATLVVIPIMDTLAAIIRRRRRKQPFHSPDKQHVHHKLLTFGYSNHTTLVMLTGATSLAGYCAFLWIRIPGVITECILLFLWLLVVVFFVVIHYINKKIRAAARLREEARGAHRGQGLSESAHTPGGERDGFNTFSDSLPRAE